MIYSRSTQFAVQGLFSIVFFFLLNTVYADRRFFVWTYEYKTMERGKAEFEQYTTFSTLDLKNRETTTTTDLQIELEVGMTDRFDVGLYQTFSQAPAGNLYYNGFKIRTRYRFGKRDQYLLDPLLYLEYKGKPGYSESILEGKLILAKEIGNFLFAVNPILEIEFEEDEIEWEPEYSLGFGYRLSNLLSAGLEVKGGSNGHYIGPVLSHGSEKLWGAIGLVKHLSKRFENESEMELRCIVGVGL